MMKYLLIKFEKHIVMNKWGVNLFSFFLAEDEADQNEGPGRHLCHLKR